jgi:ACS family allantoate permease-like MFS transporter
VFANFQGGFTKCPLMRIPTFADATLQPSASFFFILIQSFGYPTTESLLYTAPSGAVTVVFVIGSLYLSDRYKKRILFAILAMIVGILGVLLIWCLQWSYKVGSLIGNYL